MKKRIHRFKPVANRLESQLAPLQSRLTTMQNDPAQYTNAQYDIFTVGAGYPYLAAAARSNARIDPHAIALSPAVYEANSVSGLTSVWGSTAVWGSAQEIRNECPWR